MVARLSLVHVETPPLKGLKVEQGGFIMVPLGRSNQGEEIREIITLFVGNYTHRQTGEFPAMNGHGAI